MRATPAAQRIAKLIPRLATEHDGEVVATVRAIDRTLKGAGLDFHALAAALVDAQAEQKKQGERTDHSPKSWHDLAQWCRAHDKGRLADKERAFVNDMVVKLFGSVEPTPRQAEWLRTIYGKLLWGAAPF